VLEFALGQRCPWAMLRLCVFHFGKPRTPGQWIGHILAAIVAFFLVWWMLRAFVVWLKPALRRPARNWGR